MLPEKYSRSLLQFLQQSPTPYHAVENLAAMFDARGFRRLSETENWDIEPGGAYYAVRNGSSIAAFRAGRRGAESSGLRIVGAHTDSPCLKLNPNPDLPKSGYGAVSVEVYGSALLRTWFDRDLSVAGRVYYADNQGNLRHCLIDLAGPVAVIPSIAIHLDRQANTRQSIDTQKNLNPVFASPSSVQLGSGALVPVLEDACRRNAPDMEKILDFDLNLYDVAPARQTGIDGEFVSSARIDNLLSCYAGALALCNASDDQWAMLICNDHEEVGSVSDAGAQSPFLSSVIERTVGRDARIMRKSMLISADGAHGIHPNYPGKHDLQHAPELNGGIAIKRNSNQRYATTGETAALFIRLCDSVGVPYQTFVSRNDMPCGSTIGPITAAELGIRTLDAGVAQFAMHSIRETAGIVDAYHFYSALHHFLQVELPELS